MRVNTPVDGAVAWEKRFAIQVQWFRVHSATEVLLHVVELRWVGIVVVTFDGNLRRNQGN